MLATTVSARPASDANWRPTYGANTIGAQRGGPTQFAPNVGQIETNDAQHGAGVRSLRIEHQLQ